MSIDDLERLASLATPGPWYYASGRNVVTTSSPGFALPLDDITGEHRPGDVEGVATYTFIAAANPAIVLALVAELRDARLALYQIRRAIWFKDAEAHASTAAEMVAEIGAMHDAYVSAKAEVARTRAEGGTLS